MSDMGDDWREIKAARAAKRCENRITSPAMLIAEGIHFTTNNGGSHLIVQHGSKWIDFWPGTGLWHTRDGHKGRGVRNLINLIKK